MSEVHSDKNHLGIARILDLPEPTTAGEPVRNDDTRLGGTPAIGQSVYAAVEPAVGTWALPGEACSRSTYSAASALFPDPVPCEMMEPVTIPRGGFQVLASNEGAIWQASTAVTAGDFRRSVTRNGYTYEVTTAGTTGSSEPTFPTTPGDTVADGTAVWTCRAITYIVASNSTTTGNCIYISRDHGKTGFAVTAPALFTEAVFTGRNFVAVAGAAAYFYSAPDVIAFTRVATTRTLYAVATDGRGKVVFNGNNTTKDYSTNHGVSLSGTFAGSTGISTPSSVVYTGVSGSEFMFGTTSLATPLVVNSSTWIASYLANTVNGRQLSIGNGRIIASVTGGTTSPSYLDTSNLGGTWTACAVAPALCQNFRYSENYARWYGLVYTNAGTALYHSPDAVTAWSTATIAAYGIGVTGLDTGDGKFLLVGTNTTAAGSNSNIRRLITATTSGDFAGIPHAGSPSFVFGDGGGACLAFNTGGSSIVQGLKFNTTDQLFRTLPYSDTFYQTGLVVDMGAGVAITASGTFRPVVYSSDGFSTVNTASTPYAAAVSKNADGSIVYFWDAANTQVRRSTNKLLTAGSAPTVGANHAVELGFTFATTNLGVYEPAAGKHYFPGKGVNGKAAVYWINDAGTSDGVIETSLDNAQFDYLAFDGASILAVSKLEHAVWSMPIGGSFGPVGVLPTNNGLWVDFQWCPALNRFAIYNVGAVTVGLEPIWLSKDGHEWRGYGNATLAIGHGYWSEAAQRFFLSGAASSNTPIKQELRTIDNDTHFVIEAPEGGAPSNQSYYTRIL